MTIINLFGGPGCGKSTIAAGLFYKLKCLGKIDCELVTEVAKDIIWDGNVELLKNQSYVFGNQYHRLWRLRNKVDLVITDSPTLLCHIYDKEKSKMLLDNIIEKWDNFDNYSFYIERSPEFFIENGRNYDLSESLEKDKDIKALLDNNFIVYDIIYGENSEEKTEKIFNKILNFLNI